MFFPNPLAMLTQSASAQGPVASPPALPIGSILSPVGNVKQKEIRRLQVSGAQGSSAGLLASDFLITSHN